VNISAYLVSIGWPGTCTNAVNYTIAITIIATFISIFFIISRRNVFFGLVVISAFYGIIFKNQNLDSLSYTGVLKTLWFSVGIVGATTVIQCFKNEKLRKTVCDKRCVP